MTTATGAGTRILGVTQSEFGELPASPTAEVIYISGIQLNDEQPPESDPTLAGGLRGELEPSRGRLNVNGSANVVIGTSIGFWLKHLIGTPATTGDGPYVHTFAVGDGAIALPAAAAFELDYGDKIAGAGRRVRSRDVRVASAAFNYSSSTAHQTATFTLMGAAPRELPETAIDQDPDDFGHAAFELAGISVVIDGGATDLCIETLTLNWDNDLDPDQYCLNNGGQRHGLDEGRVLVSGEGVAMFDTAVMVRKAIAREDLAIAITLQRGTGTGAGTSGNEKLVITVPLSKVDAPVPAINGPRGLRQNFSFRAYRPEGSEVGVTAALHVPRETI